jgi:hypothetical protein
VSECRSCRAPILWAQTERGRRIPLDPEPYTGDDSRGLFVIRHDDDCVWVLATTPDAFPGEPHYRSHFVTCPQAGAWRRKDP